MTDKQTEVRPLSAYPVGSRWQTKCGQDVTVIENLGGDVPYPILVDRVFQSSIGPKRIATLPEVGHWTPLDPAPAQTDALREAMQKLLKAGNALAFAAETTGGTAGPDLGLQAAISEWQKAKARVRIERFEPPGTVVGAVGGAALAQPAPEPVASEPPLTFRDRAMLAALTGFCAVPGKANVHELVRDCLLCADALCAARESGK
jgi:hypothetical protein